VAWNEVLVHMATQTNAEIAQRLREIRTLMEFAGEPFFKFMAYERAAEAVRNAPPLEELIARGHRAEMGEEWSEGRLSAARREADQLHAGANPRGMQGYAVGR